MQGMTHCNRSWLVLGKDLEIDRVGLSMRQKEGRRTWDAAPHLSSGEGELERRQTR